MLSHDYSYAEILKNSLKVAWTERQVLEGRDFDYSKRFLPNRLSGVDGIRCLNEREKLKLNQIMGNAYCHIFAYVEEYIIPQALEAAQKDIYRRRDPVAYACCASPRTSRSTRSCFDARRRCSRGASESSVA